jgi:hypothetical protein
MKRIYGIAAVLGCLALGAAAQDDPSQQEVKMRLEKMAAEAKVLSVQGAVMSPTVKGAPYTADEVTESTQTLADGTRIHNENRTTVYRDGEGRIRREGPNEVSISDPVAGVRYVLNSKNQTASKMPLGNVFYFAKGGQGGTGQAGAAGTFEHWVQAPVSVGEGVVSQSNPQAVAIMKDGIQMRTFGAVGDVNAIGPMTATVVQKNAQQDSLGQQVMEGVTAEGTRSTVTLDVGTIGNDRPIQIVSERWYSPDLQTVIMTKHTDPRNGEQSFQLTNIRRGEPDPSLFQVPAGYQLIDRK